MKKNLLINAGLLAAVAVLGLIAWLKPAANDSTVRLSTQSAADVKTIELTLGSAAALALEKSAGGWTVKAPFQARGDAFVAQRLLELLDAKASARLTASGLARYGLNEPAARVKLGGQEFAFGAVNEMSREVYVQSGDGVYLLPLRYLAGLPRNPLEAASRQLFAADEAPARFEFSAFTVEQKDGKSSLQMISGAAPAGMPGADDINRWLDNWRLATAISLRPPAKAKPAGAIKVTLKNGNTVILKIIEQSDNAVIARDDEPFEYVLAGPVAKRLLQPPAAAPAAAPAK